MPPTTLHLPLILFAAVGLGACSATPERLDPATVLDARAERQAAAPEDAVFDREALVLAFVEGDARVRRAALALERAHADADAAGRLPDPTLSLQGLFLDPGSDLPSLVGGALQFALPFLSTRDAERAAADARVVRAAAELADAVRVARADATLIWIEAWAERRRSALFDAASEDFAGLAELAERMARVGELGSLDARRLAMAATRRRLDALDSRRALDAHELEVAARLDLATPPTLATPVELALALDDATHDTQLDPRMARAAADLAVAEQRLVAAARGGFAGATLGPAGEWEGGDGRFGLALSLPLPLTGRTAALRAVAEIARRAAALELELAVAAVEAERRGARRELGAARATLTGIEAEWLPLAREQWRAARTLFEAGEAGAVDLEAALTAQLEAELARIDAHARAAAAAARLERTGSTDTGALAQDER